MWLSWVDDYFALLVVGTKERVLKAKKNMTDQFECN